MYLGLKDLMFARGRFALVGLVIGLVSLMATLLSGLSNGLVDDGISGLRRLPMSHLAFQPGANSTFSRSTLTSDNLDPWLANNRVKASALGVSFFNAKLDNGSTIDLVLFGVPTDSFLVPDGRAKESLAGEPGIILSESFRELGLSVGDKLTIVGVDQVLPILGFTFAGSYGHVEIAFSSLTTWQELRYGDNAKGRFSAIAVETSDQADLAAIDFAAATTTETKQDAYQGSPGYAGETSTMGLIQGFLLVISSFIVGSFFVVWTVQRTSQIGLMKALGASTGYVIRDAIGQMVIVLVLATTTGAGLAVALGQTVNSDVPFRLEASSIAVTVGLLIGLGILGCLVALRRITSVDPIIALNSTQ